MPVILVFLVSSKMTEFSCPGCIFTSTVVLFLCIQSSPILCAVVLFGDEVVSCLGGVIVAPWLSMILFPSRGLYLVLYPCTSGTLHVLPLYG